jgi:hypothetical protein
LLRRRQGVIEDDDLAALGQHGLADLVGLAAADEISRIRGGALGRDGRHRFGTGGTRQQLQFLDAGGKVAFAEIDTD